MLTWKNWNWGKFARNLGQMQDMLMELISKGTWASSWLGYVLANFLLTIGQNDQSLAVEARCWCSLHQVWQHRHPAHYAGRKLNLDGVKHVVTLAFGETLVLLKKHPQPGLLVVCSSILICLSRAQYLLMHLTSFGSDLALIGFYLIQMVHLQMALLLWTGWVVSSLCTWIVLSLISKCSWVQTQKIMWVFVILLDGWKSLVELDCLSTIFG